MVSSNGVEVKKRAHLAGAIRRSPSLARAWLAMAPRGARGATARVPETGVVAASTGLPLAPVPHVLARSRPLDLTSQANAAVVLDGAVDGDRADRLRRRRRRRRNGAGRSGAAGRRPGLVRLR